MKYLFYYLVIINIISFIVYGLDKLFAIYKGNRVRELYLHVLSLIGGCLGSIGAMIFFRHKTKKLRFYLWNILMTTLWIYILYNAIKGRV